MNLPKFYSTIYFVVSREIFYLEAENVGDLIK